MDPGRARDLAMILLRPSDSGELRATPITNHRWALSAIGAAAACTLKPSDTVYCAIPLHHPTGILVSTGAAVASGARLSFADGFESGRFVADVRRSGATVVFYAGEMLRALLFEAKSRGDRNLPVRLFAGSGMRADLAARLRERFGVQVMEFYASTTQKVIFANASGNKPGALGRLLPGSADVALVRCDLAKKRPERTTEGRLIRALRGEPGLLAVRVSDEEGAPLEANVVHAAFVPGDRWVLTNDVLLEDEDGDHWFVDSLSAFVTTEGAAASTRKVEDALYALPEVELCAVWSEGEKLAAAIVARDPPSDARIATALEELAPHERPARVVRVEGIALTDGFRPKKSGVRDAAPKPAHREHDA
jgi:putative long chain acyl-CoA synthase